MPPLPQRADVVIVGGGVMGAAIAHALVCRGARDVLLLERAGVGSGPTGASTAIVRLHYSQPLLVRMAALGLQTYSAFRSAVGGSCGFVRTGLLVGVEEADRAALERNVSIGRAEGAVTEVVSPEQVRDLDPRLDVDELALCFELEAGYCDPYLATTGFAAAARRGGARIEEGVRVEAIAPDSVTTNAGRVAVGNVVVAAGPWTAPLLAPLAYTLPIRAARAEVGRFRLPDRVGSSPPPLADFSRLQFYFKPGEPGFLEVGSLDPRHAELAIDPDECPAGADRATLAGFAAALARRVRGADGGHWRGSWSAVYDVTPDWYPAIGLVPGEERVIVAAGFSGHGFKLAPAVGVAVAELILDGAASSYDLALLDPARFERNELVTSTYGSSVLG